MSKSKSVVSGAVAPFVGAGAGIIENIRKGTNERVDRPDGGRQPADQRHLQDQADDAGHRAADGEEGEPGEDEGDEQAHAVSWIVGIGRAARRVCSII